MSEIDNRVDAIKTLLLAFKLERILYIIISCISVGILLAVPIIIIIKYPDKIEWVVSLFVPAGMITYSIGRILKMWNQALEFVNADNKKIKRMIKKVNYSLVSAFGLLFIALGYIYLVFKIADITSEIDTKKNELTEFNLRVEKIKSELSEKEQKLEEAEKLLRIKQSLITEIDDRIESSTDKTLVRDIKNIITINQNFENAILNKIDFKESTTNKENVNSDIEKEQIPVVVEGFAYYGLFFDNEWEERHFNNLSRTSTDLPKVGDILEAITDVNIREGLIEVDDKTGKYINKKAIGLISKGDKIMVVKTHDVAGGPWKWIEFEKQ